MTHAHVEAVKNINSAAAEKQRKHDKKAIQKPVDRRLYGFCCGCGKCKEKILRLLLAGRPSKLLFIGTGKGGVIGKAAHPGGL